MQIKPRHFYASSVSDWHVDSDIERLIRYMKKHDMPFSLWYVPLDVSEAYAIESYAPKVQGAVFLTTIHP